MALSYRCCLAVLGGSLTFSLLGCQSNPTIRSSAPPPLPSQPLLPSVSSKSVPAAQPITFTVSVDMPASDLLIEPGSFIRQGEVIANPVARRTTLASQKRELETKLSSLTNAQVANTGTQPEEENLVLARKRLEAAQASLLDYQQNSPWTDFARENLPLAKEEVQLTRLQNALQQAQLNFEQAQATLTEKQSAIRTFKTQKSLTQQNLQKSLSQVTQQLTALKPLKAPHSGTITQMDLPKQPVPGQPVTVMVKLIPGDSPLPIKPQNGLPPGPSPAAPSGTATDFLPPGLNSPSPTQPPSALDLIPPSPAPNSLSPSNPVGE